MGRPSLYTPEVAARIITALELGLPRRQAAAKAGISHTAFYDWLHKGARGEEPYAEFVLRVEAAEAEAMEEDVANVRGAGGGDWRASAWMLERRFSRHFSPKMSVEFNKALEDLLKTAEEVLDVSSYQKLLTALAAQDSEEEA